MDDFNTNYDKTLVTRLNNFKNAVETNWFNYCNQYKGSVNKFSDLTAFQNYLKNPNPDDYNSFLRDEINDPTDPSKKIVAETKLVTFPTKYYIDPNTYDFSKNTKALKDFYRGYFGKDEDKKDEDKFDVPFLIQKFKYKVIAKRDILFNAALQKHVIIFSGGTGTGKSTQLPQYFLEFGFSNFKYDVKEFNNTTGKLEILKDTSGKNIQKNMLIALTQPRQLAVTTIQKSVSTFLGDWDYDTEIDGKIVGDRVINIVGKKYQGVNESGKSIQFITEGSLLTIYNNKVKEYEKAGKVYAFDEYSVIMIDEAHTRSLDIDRLLSILKNKVIPERKKDKFKNVPFLVVVMSATANLPTFEKYFGGEIAITVEGTQEPVDIRFQSEPVNDYISKSIEIAKEIHTNPNGELAYICNSTKKNNDVEYGFILSFLNTTTEINTAVEAINRIPISDKKGNYLYAYGLFSDTLTSGGANLIAALDKPKQLIDVLKNDAEKKFNNDIENNPWDDTKREKIKRAVIFATNVAEASVTIDNLSYCIDSGLEYKMIYNPTNDMNIGATVPTSKANILQRKGRVGRKQIGNYYPLFTNEINPVKQPIDQFKDLKCDIGGKGKSGIKEIKEYFKNILEKLSELHEKQYNIVDLIDNLIKLIPIYEYVIYEKLTKKGVIKVDDIENLSKIGYDKKKNLYFEIDGIKVSCRLPATFFYDSENSDKSIRDNSLEDFVNKIRTLGIPSNPKDKLTFIFDLFNNSGYSFLDNTKIFIGDYPWNASNLEFCNDILDKILALYPVNEMIKFNDVKDFSKVDIERVKNVGKLKGKIPIPEIKRYLTKKLPKLNEDTEPNILVSDLTNYLLEILNLQPINTKGKFDFKTLSKIINSEGLLINPRTENLQNAINKLIKNGLIEMSNPFSNEIRLKSDDKLSYIINMPTTFENKMMLYKSISNKKGLDKVFISTIYLAAIINTFVQKGLSNDKIKTMLKFTEKSDLIDDIMNEDNIYVPGNILFTILLFVFKYLPKLKQKINELFLRKNNKNEELQNLYNKIYDYSDEQNKEIQKIIDINNFGFSFKEEITNVFNGENKEDKRKIFYEIMGNVIELSKVIFEGTPNKFLFLDEEYMRERLLITKEYLPEQEYPKLTTDYESRLTADKSKFDELTKDKKVEQYLDTEQEIDMKEYLQRLQFCILEGYHKELCVRDGDNYLHPSGIKFIYKPLLEEERILPKYLINLEAGLKAKGYFITLGCSIEPSVYEIFKEHMDKVGIYVEDMTAKPPSLKDKIPTLIVGGKKKKLNYKQNDAFDPMIYF
jgi:HrpA-like RNA helicase